jgi:hypothetical protein
MNNSVQMRPTIVIPAYARAESLGRLLRSVAAAHYPADGVKLLISIDGGASPEVLKVARSFEFPGGELTLIERDTNLGLREHILLCGDVSLTSGAVIVLEDDLIVDPWFYRYTSDALIATMDRDELSGVALYAPAFNEFASLPFAPIRDGSDAYLMQVPCSWGQAWSSRQWEEFRSWYDDNGSLSSDLLRRIPKVAAKWPESSWKRYFFAYLVDVQKYMLYPYQSLTSNCADRGGEHVSTGSNRFQVELAAGSRDFEEVRFPADHAVTYDAYMEMSPSYFSRKLRIEADELTVDLYASKPIHALRQAQFCLTTKCVAEEALMTFPLRFRPIEQNVTPELASPSDTGIYLLATASLQAPGFTSAARSWINLRTYFIADRARVGDVLILGLISALRRCFGRLRRFGELVFRRLGL